jgi:hypothetical protein
MFTVPEQFRNLLSKVCDKLPTHADHNVIQAGSQRRGRGEGAQADDSERLDLDFALDFANESQWE